MFKNLAAYRLPIGLTLDTEAMEEALSGRPLQACGNQDREIYGWLSPKGNGRMLHVVNRQIVLTLGIEKKVLPPSVVNQVAKEKASEIEQQQGFKVGRKQMKELKDQVAEELLPRAFVRRQEMQAWIDPVNGWLVVNTSSTARAEMLLEALSKIVEDLPVKLVHTNHPPAEAMTGWLLSGEAPAGFSIDHDLELRSVDETKATVRYVRHALEGEDIGAHIATGKRATRIGMTWNDRISFVLGENMEVKRVAFLDILKEQSEQGESADEQFDLDLALMCGELAKLLTDLVNALGGSRNEL